MNRIILCALLCGSACINAAENIWIEGESAKSNTFTKHGWYDGVNKEGLSGQNWLSHYNQGKPGSAVYEFESKEGGEFVFWLRCNYFAAEMDYKLNDAEKPIDLSTPNVRDGLMISQKPDHRFIGWVKVGKMALNKGANTLTLTIKSKLANHGGVDCMVFSNTGFIPSGAVKPSAEEEAKVDTWFKVVPDVDTFSEKSVIDMSALVPKPAGKFGFLKRDGATLKFGGDGGGGVSAPTKSGRDAGPTTVKFWGINAGAQSRDSDADMKQRARYFTKHGVNMVRQHPLFDFLGPLKDGAFDAKKMDHWDRWFAALKAQGVYMTWSVFYPLKISENDGYPPELLQELKKDHDGYNTMGLVNISRPLQDLQMKYVKALLEHVNPYTKLAYKDDPALAVMEIHNEDCIFWHFPLNHLVENKWPNHAKLLRQQFSAWAKKKYGDDAALQKAWGTNESLAAGELRLYGAWQFPANRPQVDSKTRLGDFIHFLADMQREFYARRVKELRDAGFKAVTVTTAWHTGGALAEPANLYCDSAADMIDRHNYFGGGVGGHGIAVGKVSNGTHMEKPGSGILSSGFYQKEDQPFAITEWTQLPPNQWKAETAPLFAFYGMGLQGWDASYHFCQDGLRIGDGWPRLNSYVTDTPHFIGQFPALAFAIYKGHIKEAPIVSARRFKLDEIFTGDDVMKQSSAAAGASGPGADFKVATGLETPNEVLAIGRVTTSFDGKPPEKTDWTKYWDREKKIVNSATGELTWDAAKRVVTVHAPKTQGIIGFAGGGEYDLPGVKVSVKTKFCSLLFTPLDDQPLAQSKHILITALAQDQQSNTRYNEDGTQLIAIGGPPLLLEPVQATITLKGAPPTEITAVDIYGVPTQTKVKAAGNSFEIDGRWRTYYYEVKR